MSHPPIEIDLPRRIDLAAAQDVAARVRSALRNGRTEIVLRFTAGANLCSSEFIGYLAATARHIATAGGKLTITGIDAENRKLLDRLGLTAVLGLDTPAPVTP